MTNTHKKIYLSHNLLSIYGVKEIIKYEGLSLSSFDLFNDENKYFLKNIKSTEKIVNLKSSLSPFADYQKDLNTLLNKYKFTSSETSLCNMIKRVISHVIYSDKMKPDEEFGILFTRLEREPPSAIDQLFIFGANDLAQFHMKLWVYLEPDFAE